MLRLEKLNVAIIGLGVGERHLRGFQDDPRVSIVKLCDFNKEKVKEIKKKYPDYQTINDPNEILEDSKIDVISIASYDNFHSKQVIKAIQNGKHVFVEKPICLFEEELENIVETLNKFPNSKLSSNFVLRRAPQFEKLKNMINGDSFGEIYYLEGDYNYGRVHKLIDGWRGQIPFYSVMHGGGIHIIDLLTWLSKNKVVEVIGIGNKKVTKKSNFKNFDFVTSLLKFENEIIGKVSANFGSVTPHFHKISLYGTKATFFNEYQNSIIFKERENENNKEVFDNKFDNSKKANVLKSFILSIIENQKPDVTAQEVIDIMSISLAIEKSLTSKKWEPVKYYKLYK